MTSRPALSDVTNDSPITGVAKEAFTIKTPNRVQACKNTPGSGESLLRGQVKSLLQKVEEEAEFVNKISSENRPPFRVLLDLPAPSPVQMLAPTPANTPQVIEIVQPVKPEETVPLVIQEEESALSRTLLFDSPDSENTDNTSSISSSLSYQGSGIRSSVNKCVEDDSSSAWSLQVNVSLEDEDEEETITDFDEEEYDDLCDGINKINMDEEKVELPEFEGKHTRFVYDSDDEEIKGEELIVRDKVVSPNAVVLKGLPVPEGKHLRFHEEEEDEDN